MNPSILSVGSAVPPRKLEQEEVYEFMKSAMPSDKRTTLLLRKVFSRSGVKTRHSLMGLGDGNGEDIGYSSGNGMPSTEERMSLYREHAPHLGFGAVNDCLGKMQNFDPAKITHVITFSCTGMYAPGLDIDIVNALGLDPSTERTNIGFMGCHAAFNALKSAYHIVRSTPGAMVLLAGVELCSLHYLPGDSFDSVAASAIFGDGASAALVGAEENGSAAGRKLRVKKFHSGLAPEGKNEMALTVGNSGISLRLSDDVPSLVESGIQKLTSDLLSSCSVNQDDISYYAIHPGGVRILQGCEAALGIDREQNRISYDVLSRYGNMSSVTILFVLKELMDTLRPEDEGKTVFSCAFGPGLTMESVLFEIA